MVSRLIRKRCKTHWIVRRLQARKHRLKNPGKQDIFEVTPRKGVEVKVFDAGIQYWPHFYIGKTGADFFRQLREKRGI